MRHLLVPVVWTAACGPSFAPPGLAVPAPAASPLASGGFRSLDHPAGLAWTTDGPDPTVVVLVDLDAPGLAPGLYIERGVQDWSFSGWMDWREEDGRFPLLLTLPPRFGSPVLHAGDSLLLRLRGSTEHGCTDPTLLAEVIPEADGTVTVLVEGVPYFALPSKGTLWVDGDSEYDLASPPADDLEDVRSLEVETPDLPGLRATFSSPLPFLQLEGRQGFVEVDLDHSCEVSGWTGVTTAWEAS